MDRRQRLDIFLERIRNAYQGQDINALRALLNLQIVLDIPPQVDIERAVTSRLGPREYQSFSDAVIALVHRSQAFERLNLIECFNHHLSLTKSLVKGDLWQIAPGLFSDLRKIAAHADDQYYQAGQTPQATDETSRYLMSQFPVAPKEFLLNVSNELLRIAMKNNNPTSLKSVSDNMSRNPLELYPLPQRVIYNFFQGRIQLFDSNFERAIEFLNFVYENCPSKCYSNRRLTLVSLVPLRMLHFRLPSVRLLTKYNLPQYLGIRLALKTGNVAKFRAALDEHQDFFIRAGVYMLLTRLEILAFRCFVRRVHFLRGQELAAQARTPQAKQQAEQVASQVPIEEMAVALGALGHPIELPELEGILALLVARGFIKGYLLHSKKLLVCSMITPFPPLRTTLQPSWWR
ncbi:putative PCI domain protein [Paratrimastix pyriformis]|uniref:PCI domain protein n=1 Tax=Paratrimastix pyriformis TaxID=342808 RepID=A0ABQ8U5I9_9EUKA|nr:putative PCI domain protein [Paratrimastix pyriformis]